MGPKWGTKVVSKHGANVDIIWYVKLGIKKDTTLGANLEENHG